MDDDGAIHDPHSGSKTDPAERFFRCWACGLPFTRSEVKREGIIQSRRDRYGGPFYHYVCPRCGEENRCESTALGTFFASPPFIPTLLDWLLGKLAGTSAETFLKITAWYHREKERRRYVFERDGDFRYSSLGERIRWYFRRSEERIEIPHELPAMEIRVPSPYRILGLKPGAGPRER